MTRYSRDIRSTGSSDSDARGYVRVQRKCKACGASSGEHEECEDCAAQRVQRKTVHVGPADDRYEREADRIADQVIRGASADSPSVLPSEPSPRVQPKHLSEGAGSHLVQTSSSAGQALDRGTREYMEARFARDFSQVRVHTDLNANAAARAINARAYTAGRDIHFARGEFDPARTEGRRLLAHELTHTLQQGQRAARVQRAPGPAAASTTDPVCTDYDHAATEKEVDRRVETFKADKEQEQARLLLIRALKLVRRCATAEQVEAIRAKLAAELGGDADAIWRESGKAFGGYVGFHPGYAADVRGHLKQLGVSKTRSSKTFKLWEGGRKHRSRAAAVGKAAVEDLKRTDVVYFRGHQYAQYRGPGLFANGSKTLGFDLRYIEETGGFANVKLMISTSCATLCNEALDVFTALFPNAVILGFRTGAPEGGGLAVRRAFGRGVAELDTPLLLDQAADINSIISVWRSVVESKHRGRTRRRPGFFSGGKVHFWDGKRWREIARGDPANNCERHGNYSRDLPGPARSGTSESEAQE